MISNLFPKNPVFMCFGGGGSGGSSSGAASSGGGSRADRKGAAAVFSAPKPVYTPPPTVVNTSRDRRDRTPVVVPAPVVNYGALPLTPPPSVIASAPSVTDNLSNIELVGKDRPYLEYAGSDGPEPSELTSPPFKTPSPVYMQQDNTGGNARTLQLQQDDYDISRRYIDSLNKKSSQTPRFRPKDLSIDPLYGS
jgi:hypothetical protein